MLCFCVGVDEILEDEDAAEEASEEALQDKNEVEFEVSEPEVGDEDGEWVEEVQVRVGRVSRTLGGIYSPAEHVLTEREKESEKVRRVM